MRISLIATKLSQLLYLVAELTQAHLHELQNYYPPNGWKVTSAHNEKCMFVASSSKIANHKELLISTSSCLSTDWSILVINSLTISCEIFSSAKPSLHVSAVSNFKQNMLLKVALK